MNTSHICAELYRSILDLTLPPHPRDEHIDDIAVNAIMPARILQSRSPESCKIGSCSDYSVYSDYSASTAPTDNSTRPSVQDYKQSRNPSEEVGWDIPHYSYRDCVEPKASAETYAFSVSSETPDQSQDQALPPYEVPLDGYELVATKPLASSSQEFAEYFPSTQRLCIRHDDSTLDGNMNLRVDTKARTFDGGDVDLTLFHLRMHDLKRREFSLRRYCRDSGREICHSSMKCVKPSIMKRPGLQRSMSNALSSLRAKSDSKVPTITGLKRHDSGYDSMPEDEFGHDDEVSSSRSLKSLSNLQLSTNTTLLEFSNYAHLEIIRRGAKASERYEFEYWGTKYAWKRIAVASGNFKEVSYHLCSTKTSASLAHIVPIPQSSSDLEEELAKGGWVPPCALILEESVIDQSTDLAE